jgi:hypothetical protein
MTYHDEESLKFGACLLLSIIVVTAGAYAVGRALSEPPTECVTIGESK